MTQAEDQERGGTTVNVTLPRRPDGRYQCACGANEHVSPMAATACMANAKRLLLLAEISDLRAQLAQREAEIARLKAVAVRLIGPHRWTVEEGNVWQMEPSHRALPGHPEQCPRCQWEAALEAQQQRDV